MQKTRLNEFELRSFQQDRNLPVLYNRDRILPVLYQGQKHNQINKTTVNESIGALLVRYLAVPLIYSVFSKLFGAKEDTASEDEALFPNHDEVVEKLVEMRRDMHFEKERRRREKEKLHRVLQTQQRYQNIAVCFVIVTVISTLCYYTGNNQLPLFNSQASRNPTFYEYKSEDYGSAARQSGNYQSTAHKSANVYTQSGTRGASESAKSYATSQYGEDRRNDPPKKQPPNKRNQDQTNVTVGYDGLGRVIRLSAIVRLENLGQGSAPTPKMRQWIREIGEKSDVAGHILASMLGGSGADSDNIVPMSSSFNNGDYKAYEFYVRGQLKELSKKYPGQQVEARINIRLSYPGDSWRPHKIKYCVDFYVDGHLFLYYIDGIFHCP